jgi:hypothetical protein
MQTGPNVLGIVENESGSAKHENDTRLPRKCLKQVRLLKIRKRYPAPSGPPKTASGAQNMILEPGSRGTTAENGSGSAKN